jgi:hypothetical protein
MQLSQCLDERQAYAEPGPRALERPIDLREHVENALELIASDADAGIAHADDHL